MATPSKIGFGFYGPVGPKGMTVRCTFGFTGSKFVVLNVAAGLKEVPTSRLMGEVCRTPNGNEMGATWGAGHWTNKPETVPVHIRKMIRACRVTGEKAALLEAMALQFERELTQS